MLHIQVPVCFTYHLHVSMPVAQGPSRVRSTAVRLLKSQRGRGGRGGGSGRGAGEGGERGLRGGESGEPVWEPLTALARPEANLPWDEAARGFEYLRCLIRAGSLIHEIHKVIQLQDRGLGGWSLELPEYLKYSKHFIGAV